MSSSLTRKQQQLANLKALRERLRENQSSLTAKINTTRKAVPVAPDKPLFNVVKPAASVETLSPRNPVGLPKEKTNPTLKALSQVNPLVAAASPPQAALSTVHLSSGPPAISSLAPPPPEGSSRKATSVASSPAKPSSASPAPSPLGSVAPQPPDVLSKKASVPTPESSFSLQPAGSVTSFSSLAPSSFVAAGPSVRLSSSDKPPSERRRVKAKFNPVPPSSISSQPSHRGSQPTTNPSSTVPTNVAVKLGVDPILSVPPRLALADPPSSGRKESSTLRASPPASEPSFWRTATRRLFSRSEKSEDEIKKEVESGLVFLYQVGLNHSSTYLVDVQRIFKKLKLIVLFVLEKRKDQFDVSDLDLLRETLLTDAEIEYYLRPKNLTSEYRNAPKEVKRLQTNLVSLAQRNPVNNALFKSFEVNIVSKVKELERRLEELKNRGERVSLRKPCLLKSTPVTRKNWLGQMTTEKFSTCLNQVSTLDVKSLEENMREATKNLNEILDWFNDVFKDNNKTYNKYQQKVASGIFEDMMQQITDLNSPERETKELEEISYDSQVNRDPFKQVVKRILENLSVFVIRGDLTLYIESGLYSVRQDLLESLLDVMQETPIESQNGRAEEAKHQIIDAIKFFMSQKPPENRKSFVFLNKMSKELFTEVGLTNNTRLENVLLTKDDVFDEKGMDAEVMKVNHGQSTLARIFNEGGEKEKNQALDVVASLKNMIDEKLPELIQKLQPTGPPPALLSNSKPKFSSDVLPYLKDVEHAMINIIVSGPDDEKWRVIEYLGKVMRDLKDGKDPNLDYVSATYEQDIQIVIGTLQQLVESGRSKSIIPIMRETEEVLLKHRFIPTMSVGEFTKNVHEKMLDRALLQIHLGHAHLSKNKNYRRIYGLNGETDATDAERKQIWEDLLTNLSDPQKSVEIVSPDAKKNGSVDKALLAINEGVLTLALLEGARGIYEKYQDSVAEAIELTNYHLRVFKPSVVYSMKEAEPELSEAADMLNRHTEYLHETVLNFQDRENSKAAKEVLSNLLLLLNNEPTSEKPLEIPKGTTFEGIRTATTELNLARKVFSKFLFQGDEEVKRAVSQTIGRSAETIGLWLLVEQAKENMLHALDVDQSEIMAVVTELKKLSVTTKESKTPLIILGKILHAIETRESGITEDPGQGEFGELINRLNSAIRSSRNILLETTKFNDQRFQEEVIRQVENNKKIIQDDIQLFIEVQVNETERKKTLTLRKKLFGTQQVCSDAKRLTLDEFIREYRTMGLPSYVAGVYYGCIPGTESELPKHDYESVEDFPEWENLGQSVSSLPDQTPTTTKPVRVTTTGFVTVPTRIIANVPRRSTNSFEDL
jgi:hypothetical protein